MKNKIKTVGWISDERTDLQCCWGNHDGSTCGAPVVYVSPGSDSGYCAVHASVVAANDEKTEGATEEI